MKVKKFKVDYDYTSTSTTCTITGFLRIPNYLMSVCYPIELVSKKELNFFDSERKLENTDNFYYIPFKVTASSHYQNADNYSKEIGRRCSESKAKLLLNGYVYRINRYYINRLNNIQKEVENDLIRYKNDLNIEVKHRNNLLNNI